ncbi:ABC transporter permease [Pseudoclavibacter sp. AY1F1]|uniref:zinc ABC transporter permease AztB n=1 Tax=Pseudoclavibacter sp. AY1F1 TaxID=2080583 RepID=UPI000CE7AEB4|nr:zinc ABC transporter permease AztB [Pseudoclavibacter sp. AY1F1]PPF46810.1 ABC transporter permease [Pseudoclavibacter sp. AY1F1]
MLRSFLVPFLTDPLEASFFVRALLGGSLAAVLCACVGTWVVLRGMAFLGEALAHGILPGVAVSVLLGFPPVAGAAVSAAVMAVGVRTLTKRTRLSNDTAIGILFVGMLALGIAIVSKSGSFAVDVTAMLFGDVLAIGPAALWLIGTALALAVAGLAVYHRGFTALAFDERKAFTLGLRPERASLALIALVALAVIASYQAIGTLLVTALLLAPPAAASLTRKSVVGIMALGSTIGIAAVVVGLYASWHLSIAAGPVIALAAVLSVAVASALRPVRRRRVSARPPAQSPSQSLAQSPAPAPAPAESAPSCPTHA